MEGDGKFLKSLYIVDRGVQAQFIYEDPLYCVRPPPFFKFCPHTPTSPPPPPILSLFPITSKPQLCYFLSCHVSLVEWVITPHLMCYFT